MAIPFVGEIRMVGFSFAPVGWQPCNGQMMAIAENETLFNLIGTTYGGDGQQTYALPDLQSRFAIDVGQGNGLSNRILGESGGAESVTLTTQQIPAHTHSFLANSAGSSSASPNGKIHGAASGLACYDDPATANGTMLASTIGLSGGSQPHDNMPPFAIINFILSEFGAFPGPDSGGDPEPFLGEIRLFSFNFAPKGWTQCNGQLLPINQNQALFSLLGTMYGGDGRVNFALPDLRSRIPYHLGNGLTQGEKSGQEGHTLIQSEVPAHNHPVVVSSHSADQPSPQNALWANAGTNRFAAASAANSLARGTDSTGGSQGHNNMPPYLVINYCIALQGIFPSRN